MEKVMKKVKMLRLNDEEVEKVREKAIEIEKARQEELARIREEKRAEIERLRHEERNKDRGFGR